MSSFMVSDKTINRIVTFLDAKLLDEWPHFAEKFEQLGFDVQNDQFCYVLGRAMFVLNMRGVDARYGEGSAKEFRELNYTFHPRRAGAFQVYKSLGCWLYQCMEGNTPDDPLYKLMREVEATLANWIIHRLPEYDGAEWG
jgi:hypothetical protein